MRPFPDETDLLRWEDDGGNPKWSFSRETALTVVALVEQVMAKCDTLGIPWGEFYRAMREAQKAGSRESVRQLFADTFASILENT